MAHGGLPVALAQQELEQDLNLCPPEQIPGSESLCVRLGDRVRIESYQATAFALCSHQHREGGQAPLYLQIGCLYQGRPGSTSVPRVSWGWVGKAASFSSSRSGLPL